MSEQRLSAEERRAAIMTAVWPLFARQGFAQTTTKDLAEAAGVSEALLYKHFPSKESLYTEIKDFGCHGSDPALEKIAELKPSTSTLVHLIFFLMRSLAVGKRNDPVGWETRHRMVLHSCLEDGKFPRHLFNNHFACCFTKLEACFEAAEAAGCLVTAPVSRQNRLLFAHHLACMTAIMHLPEKPIVDYQVSREELLHQAVWFVLRGIGLTDKAIAKYYDSKLRAEFFASDDA